MVGSESLAKRNDLFSLIASANLRKSRLPTGEPRDIGQRTGEVEMSEAMAEQGKQTGTLLSPPRAPPSTVPNAFTLPL
jgi:hypothetical protein